MIPRRVIASAAALGCVVILGACGGETARSSAIDACIGMRMVSSLLSSGSTGIEQGVLNARTSIAAAASSDVQTYGRLDTLMQQFPTVVTAVDAAAAEAKMQAIAAECRATGYVWT